MTTKFETLTEEKKAEVAYGYALQHAQGFLCNTEMCTGLKDYQNELKAMIEWLRPKLGLEGMRLY